MAINLWGDLPDGSDIRTPFAILKEQGVFLEQSTKGLLTGVVSRSVENGSTVLSFFIQAPALNSYNFQVAQVNHPIDLYPLVIRDVANAGRSWTRCDDEAAFVKALSLILAAERTKSVVRGLLAQIRAEIGA